MIFIISVSNHSVILSYLFISPVWVWRYLRDCEVTDVRASCNNLQRSNEMHYCPHFLLLFLPTVVTPCNNCPTLQYKTSASTLWHRRERYEDEIYARIISVVIVDWRCSYCLFYGAIWGELRSPMVFQQWTLCSFTFLCALGVIECPGRILCKVRVLLSSLWELQRKIGNKTADLKEFYLSTELWSSRSQTSVTVIGFPW
jgi:hypothetical protein